MTAPAAPPTPKEARAKTAYHVLKQTNVSGGIPTFRVVVNNLRAANAEAAIHSYATHKNDNKKPDANPDVADIADGTYVAIPARSWKPVTVKTETTTHLTIT